LQAVGRSTFRYDPRGRLAELTHRDAVDAVLAEYKYTFDLADQLIRKLDQNQLSEYTYDPAGQLIGADHSGQGDETYAYDANGNRLEDLHVIGPNNQVLSDATYDYQYDTEGNLVGRTERATGVVRRYTYDHRNRLVRFEQRSAGGILLAEAEYVYDVFDRRIVKSVDPDGAGPAPRQETRFAYEGLNAWADFDALNQVTARYLHGEGLDNLLARWRPGDGTAWYLTDHLGTVRDIADAAGAVINRLDYDSFGRLVTQTNPVAGDRFGFTGREYDPELGWYFYRARYYDPQLGRFVSQDPLGFAAGDSNLYRYVGNAPLTTRDPLGLAGTSLFYALMSRRASAAAGAILGGALGYACGWAEGFTEVMSSSENPDSEVARGVARQRALTYAAWGAALGAALSPLGVAAQRLAGGIFLVGAAVKILMEAPASPWEVTAVRVGCVVVSAAVGPRAQRWLTRPISRLPFMGVRSPSTLRSPTPLVPRVRPSAAPEPHPVAKPPSSEAIAEPATSRSPGALRQLQFRFMEEGETAESTLQAAVKQLPIGLRAPTTDELIAAHYQRYYTEAWQQVIQQFNRGKFSVPAGMNWRTILGKEVDAIARARLRLYLAREGIAEGRGESVLVNRRLYDPSGSGRYRVPDVQLDESRLIMDGTIGGKDMNSPQVRDFQTFSGGYRVLIVRPGKGG
jgi:RHS repeat-associated protein